MKRIRMTVVYEFSWASEELTGRDVDGMANNFLQDPAAFMNLEYPEWDEEIIIDFEDVTDGN